MKSDADLRAATANLRKHGLRLAIAIAAWAWAVFFLRRPSVPVSSRWGWFCFFAVLTVAQAARTFVAWRMAWGFDGPAGPGERQDCGSSDLPLQ